jgi:hypothetical protein
VPIYKGLNHVQDLEAELGFIYISGLCGTRTLNAVINSQRFTNTAMPSKTGFN